MTASEYYQSREFRKFYDTYMFNLGSHQMDAKSHMLDHDRATICMPTGTGKSRVIYSDLLTHIQFNTLDTFAIVSHRLLLNTQHFDEVFNVFKQLMPHVGFIFVGSYQIDLAAYKNDRELNTKLSDAGIAMEELVSSISNTDEISKKIESHYAKGRDVIVISTYHSLEKLRNVSIHSIYCDEAHFLASTNETAQFKKNFEKITAKRNFFFTATPRDLKDESYDVFDTFLMNNKEIFGERFELTFKEALEMGLIVKPYMHILEIGNFADNKNYLSTVNYARFIVEAFEQHKTTMKNSTKCAAKLLVKCPSVDEMWKIKRKLAELMPTTKVFAGACRGDIDSVTSFKLDDEEIRSKSDFLVKLKMLGDSEEAVILHFDILSEGIDVPGITGVMFLSKGLPSVSKICQTIGRATRLHWEDRKNLKERKIGIEDYDKMVKPYCAVILPIMSVEMNFSVENIARMIIRLRDEYKIPTDFATIGGEDRGGEKVGNEIEALNKLDEKKDTLSKIGSIKQYIELFDNQKVVEIKHQEVLKIFELKEKNPLEFVKQYSEYIKSL